MTEGIDWARAEPGATDASAPRYIEVETIGRGAMGQVTAVEDLRLMREVARKTALSEAPEAVRRFVHEAQITGQLEHPNIGPIYDLGVDVEGRPFYTMKRIRGEPLGAAIAAGRLARLDDRLEVFRKVCDAIEFAHARGVIHRDLKPDNIMVGAFGEVLVLDWGLAKVVGRDALPRADTDPPSLVGDTARAAETLTQRSVISDGYQGTRLGEVIGTPEWMPPEQAAGRADAIGPWSDVYALGGLLGWLITGQTPAGWRSAHGSTRSGGSTGSGDALKGPAELDRPGPAPAELLAVVARATALHWADRYPTASALRAEIDAWLGGRLVSVVDYGLTGRFGKWAHRHRAVLTAAALSLTAGLVAIAALVARHVDELQTETTRATRASEAADAARRGARLRLAEARLSSAAALDQEHRAGPARAALDEAWAILSAEGASTVAVELRRAELDARHPPAEARFAVPRSDRRAVSPDGLAAVIADARGAQVRALPSGDPLARLDCGADAGPVAVGWTQAGAWLACSTAHLVRIHRLGERSQSWRITGPVTDVWAIAETGDWLARDREGATELLTPGWPDAVAAGLPPQMGLDDATADGRLLAIDLSHGRPGVAVVSWPDGAQRGVWPQRSEAVFVGDGRSVVLGDLAASHLERVRLADGAIEWRVPAASVSRMRADAEGRLFASTARGIEVRAVDDGRLLGVLAGAGPSDWYFAIARRGGRVLAHDQTEHAEVFTAPTAASGVRLSGPSPFVMAAHDQGVWWAMGGGEVWWLAHRSDGPRRIARVTTGRLRDIATSPDGRHALTAGDEGRAWVVSRGGVVERPMTHPEGAAYMAAEWLPDRPLLVLADARGHLEVRARDGRIRHRLAAHDGPIWDLFVSPDGLLASTGRADHDSRVRLWRVSADARLELVETRVAPTPLALYRGALSADGRHLIVAHHDEGAWLWDRQSPEPPLNLPLDGGPALVAAFDARAERVAVAGYSGAVHLYGIDGTPLAVASHHLEPVTALAVTDDGWIYSAASDQRLVRWSMRPRRPTLSPGTRASTRATAG